MATIQDLANLSAVAYGDKAAQNYLASNGWQLIDFSASATNELASQFATDGYYGRYQRYRSRFIFNELR